MVFMCVWLRYDLYYLFVEFCPMMAVLMSMHCIVLYCWTSASGRYTYTVCVSVRTWTGGACGFSCVWLWRVRPIDELGVSLCSLSLVSVSVCDTPAVCCGVCPVAPRLSRPPLSERVTEGESVEFDCRVIGTRFPVTTISWTKNERPLHVSLFVCQIVSILSVCVAYLPVASILLSVWTGDEVFQRHNSHCSLHPEVKQKVRQLMASK